MECPKCGLINPDSAERRDCGYDFPTGQIKKSYLGSCDNAGQESRGSPTESVRLAQTASRAQELRSNAVRMTPLPIVAGVVYLILGGYWLVIGFWQLAWTYTSVEAPATGGTDLRMVGAMNVLVSLIDLLIGFHLTRRSKRAYSYALWIAVANVVFALLPGGWSDIPGWALLAYAAVAGILWKSRREFDQLAPMRAATKPRLPTPASDLAEPAQAPRMRHVVRPVLRGCLWAFLASLTAFVGMWVAYLPATVSLLPFDAIPHSDWAAAARMLALMFFIITPLAAPVLGLVFGLTGACIGSRVEQRWKWGLSVDPSGNIGRALGALFAGGLAGALLTVLVIVLMGAALESPAATGTHAQEARSAYNEGVDADDMGNHDQAIAYYSRALELDPQFAAAYYHRGVSFYTKGLCEPAIEDYTRFIELNPNSADGYFDRGNAYLLKEDFAQAIRDLTRSIELRPERAEAYRSRGKASRGQESKSQAITDFETYLRLAPNASDRAEVEGWIRDLR